MPYAGVTSEPTIHVVHIRRIQSPDDLVKRDDVSPHDVIIHGDKVKHWVNGRLRDHDLLHGAHGEPAPGHAHGAHGAHGSGGHAHDDPELEADRQATLIFLNTGRGDQVVWVADEPFAVVQIVPRDGKHPHVPFKWMPPACSGVTKRVASGPPERHKERRVYKVTFAMGNQLIDPDLVCDPPGF